MRIRLLSTASRDLREIRAYIAFDNPKAALMVVRKLQTAVEFIAQRPFVGRPTINNNVREWSVPGLPYVVPYRVGPETLEIIHFWHTSRDRPKSWQ